MSSGSKAGNPHTAKMKKEESFLGKLGGTLARKKKSKEASRQPVYDQAVSSVLIAVSTTAHRSVDAGWRFMTATLVQGPY
ncbi:hypothetical protein NHX12_002957 [Muraenolepis orangiensis]|uniref:Uncharacterized protein n=1 Tax=Muraenolepis orangiensis TaxID=630683 RepID=A0A9Q0E1T9_9TELE|nr:hypothetical protein NHX12_002957 [Muraenolepis orangiensis]